MAKSKYYAIRVGKRTGIFKSWDKCKSYVHGYSGAEYKSFSNEQDALAYLKGEKAPAKRKLIPPMDQKPTKEQSKKPINPLKQPDTPLCEIPVDKKCIAYVDGSYNSNTNTYGSGGIIIFSNGDKIEFSASGNDSDFVSMRNVAGEIFASMDAISKAIMYGCESITIYYDYEGIEKWAVGDWKANKTGTKLYKRFIAENSTKIHIDFVKVKAHTGVEYNEVADMLAKRAAGVE